MAKDAYGNPIEGAIFSEDSEDAFIEGNAFIATKAGTYVVTATKDDVTVSSEISVFGAVAAVKIVVPEVIVANGSTEYTIEVWAVDEAGNLVTTAQYDFELNGVAGFQPTPKKSTKDGVKVYTVKADPAVADADITLTAAYDHDNDKDFSDAGTKKGEVVVTPVAQVASEIKIEADEEYLPSDATDNTVEFTVSILDQVGKKVAEDVGSWEMKLKITGPAVFENGRRLTRWPWAPAARSRSILRTPVSPVKSL